MKSASKGSGSLPLHEVIAKAIERVKVTQNKTQIDIARELGYELPNMLAMIKNGTAKLPLAKIPALAKAVDLDPAYLLRLAMAQEWPDLASTIRQVFGTVLTENERLLIEEVRTIMKDEDAPRLTRDMARQLKHILTS